jgi:tetratricopeptide (TPR) repeat protein
MAAPDALGHRAHPAPGLERSRAVRADVQPHADPPLGPLLRQPRGPRQRGLPDPVSAKNDFSTWPLSDGPYRGVDYAPGTDLSWWKNHPTPVSFFVFDSDLDFFGGYDHGRRAGVAHVADHETVPGKKLWEWGNGPDGFAWDSILTDEDGPYIELMAGGFSDNQPDYSWIEPGQARTLVQSWYPIRELGGLRAANTDAAVHLEVEGRTARLAANATSRHEGARVRLTAGERLLFEDTVTLAPDAPFTREVGLGEAVGETDLRLAILASDGSELVAYQPSDRPETPEPPHYEPPAPPAEIASVEELVLAGQRLEQFHNPSFAPEPYYEEALRRDPGSSAAHVALGTLALRRGQLAKAEDHLGQAVNRVTANHTRARSGQARYLHGLALQALGRSAEAREAFAAAAWDRAWAGAASLAQARLESAAGDRQRALALVDRAVTTAPRSTAALGLKAALLRRADRPDEARASAEAALAIDPLDPLAARERSLVHTGDGRDPATDPGVEAALRSLDEDQYALEIAHDYAQAGLLDDAVALLEARLPVDEPGATADPLVAYTLAWLHGRRGDGDAAAAWARRGRELPSDYCFPFRTETIAVLENAMALDDTDPRAPYYLGNLLYDLQPERAIEKWERARALAPDFARVHRNLAFAYARVRGDLEAAVASQEKAVTREKGEPRLYYELDRLLEWSQAPLETRLGWLRDSPRTVASRDITRARLARVQLLGGQASEALETLAGGRFHVWEGERGIHEVYVQARLERGRRCLAAGDAEGALTEFRAAVAVPANIEVGRDTEAHLPAVRFHEGLALRALGREAEAEEAFRWTSTARTATASDAYWVGRSLRELGQDAESRTRFEALARTTPSEADEALPLESRMEANAERANDFYLRALGFDGLGRPDETGRWLGKALRTDPSHLEAVEFQRSLPGPAPRPAGPTRRQIPAREPAPRAPAQAPPERPPAEAPPTRPPAEAPPGGLS